MKTLGSTLMLLLAAFALAQNATEQPRFDTAREALCHPNPAILATANVDPYPADDLTFVLDRTMLGTCAAYELHEVQDEHRACEDCIPAAEPAVIIDAYIRSMRYLQDARPNVEISFEELQPAQAPTIDHQTQLGAGFMAMFVWSERGDTLITFTTRQDPYTGQHAVIIAVHPF